MTTECDIKRKAFTGSHLHGQKLAIGSSVMVLAFNAENANAWSIRSAFSRADRLAFLKV